MDPLSIRIYSPFFPYPPNGGAEHTIFHQIKDFHEKGYSIELVILKHSYQEIETMKEAGYFEPFPEEVKVISLTSNKMKKKQILKKWLEKIARVFSSLLSCLSSPELFYYPPHLLRKWILQVDPSHKIDIGIYHYSFSYAWLKFNQKFEKKTVVIFHNLESDLFKLRAQLEPNPLLKAIYSLNAKKLKSHEKKISTYCDKTWFNSPVDLKNNCIESINEIKSQYVPPGYSKNLRTYRNKRFIEKNPEKTILGFIGHLDFKPNANSVEWILKELAPELKNKDFNGEIHIVGKNPPSSLLQLAKNFKFIHFFGFIEDIELFWENVSFSLVPHVSGSGVRMKLLESIASGVPTLCNTSAAERIHPHLNKHPLLFISDYAEEWAQFLIEKKDPAQMRKKEISDTLPLELNVTDICDKAFKEMDL